MLTLRSILCSALRGLAPAALAAAALAGCGQKGPLFLPEEPAAANRATLPEILTRRGGATGNPAPAPLPGSDAPRPGGTGTGTASPVRAP